MPREKIMKTRTVIALIAAVTLFATVAHLQLGAQEAQNTEADAFAALVKAKTLKCYLGKGSAANWDAGDVEIKMVKEYSKKQEDCIMIFDSIDLKNDKARLIGNQGSTDVMAFATVGGVTFIEQAGGGSVFVTTIFPKYKKGSNELLFVHSRHFAGFVSGPMPSQYYGTCRILE